MDEDKVFEGVFEEKSSKGEYSKLRYEDGTHRWKETRMLQAIEELPGRSPYAQPDLTDRAKAPSW